MEMLTVRLTDELFVRLTELAEAQQIKRSALVRELLAVPTFGGVGMDQLRQLVIDAQVPAPETTTPEDIHPPSRPLAIGQVGRRIPDGCRHPNTAIKRMPFTDICTLCGETVRKR